MPSWETHSNLSGSGYQAFSAAGLTFGFYSELVVPGLSEMIDAFSDGRRSKIGYVAVVEDYSAGGPGGVLAAGLYKREPIWIPFDLYTFATLSHVPLEASGLDGYIYRFFADVVVTLRWGY